MDGPLTGADRLALGGLDEEQRYMLGRAMLRMAPYGTEADRRAVSRFATRSGTIWAHDIRFVVQAQFAAEVLDRLWEKTPEADRAALKSWFAGFNSSPQFRTNEPDWAELDEASLAPEAEESDYPEPDQGF